MCMPGQQFCQERLAVPDDTVGAQAVAQQVLAVPKQRSRFHCPVALPFQI